MANGWSLLWGLVIVVAGAAAAWFFSPRGDNQTIWRSSLILSLASGYIMWAITFLAQWHPLVVPKRSDWRPERVPH